MPFFSASWNVYQEPPTNSLPQQHKLNQYGGTWPLYPIHNRWVTGGFIFLKGADIINVPDTYKKMVIYYFGFIINGSFLCLSIRLLTV